MFYGFITYYLALNVKTIISVLIKLEINIDYNFCLIGCVPCHFDYIIMLMCHTNKCSTPTRDVYKRQQFQESKHLNIH